MRRDELKSRARELERAGQSVAAREVYVGLAPQEEPEGAALVWRRVAQIDLSAGNRSSARESLFRAAELFAEAGQLNNALAVCLQLVDLAPEDGTTHLKLAELATAQGYRDLARTWAIRSAASATDPPRLDQAARAAGTFGARFPIDMEFWRHWAEGALSAHGPEGAIQALQRLKEQVSASGASPHALIAIRDQLGRLGSSSDDSNEPGGQGASSNGSATRAPDTAETFISPGPLLTDGWSDADPADADLRRATHSLREPEPTWESSSSRVIPLEGLEHTHAEAWETSTPEPEEPEAVEDLPLLGATDSETPDDEPPLPWLVDDTAGSAAGTPPVADRALPSWLEDASPDADGASPPDVTGPTGVSWPDEDLPLMGASPTIAANDPSDPWLQDTPESQSPESDENSAQPLPLLAPFAAAGSTLAATGLEALHRELETIVTRQVEPSDAATHYDLGLAFKEMGLTEEAVAQLAAAIVGGFRTLAGLEVMGEILHSRGDYPAAARILRHASDDGDSADRDLVGVLYWLGRTEQALGNSSDARRLFGRVVAIDPAFRDASLRLSSVGSALL